MSRYIDADTIQYDEDIPDIYTVSKTRIDNMPTADVRENVRGEWKSRTFYDSTLVCSECGAEGRWDFEYCPYCGADMRGEIT